MSAPVAPAGDIGQHASARLRVGERVVAEAEVQVTPAGLLAIGGMVGAILLGSAAIVLAAGRARREAEEARRNPT